MELQLKIIGVLLLILAGIHVFFPRYFNWKAEFESVSLINRQMMYVHTFFIVLIVFLMGLLCLSHTNELINKPFGRVISLGMGIFWFARLLTQFFWYSPKLWKGKSFETAIHIIFSLLWIYLSGIFSIIYFKIR